MNPWDKQTGESAEAFEAFNLYCDMGVARRQTKVSKKLGKSTDLINRWCAKWHWVQRASDWDTAAAARAREGELSAIEKMRAKHIEMAVDLHTLGHRQLAKWFKLIDDANTADGVIPFKPSELVRLIEAGIKLERLSRGEADTISKNIHTGNDDKAIELALLSSLNTGELVNLAKEAIKSFEGDNDEQDQDE